MTIYAFISLLSATLCLCLACIVFLRDSRNPLNRIFSLLCISFSVWAFLEFLTRQAESPERAMLFLRFESIRAVTIAFFLHFVIIFNNIKSKRHRIFLVFTYIAAFAIGITDFVFLKRTPVMEDWGWTAGTHSPELLYTFVLGWAAFTIVSALLILIRYYPKAKDSHSRVQIKYVLVGMLTTCVAGLISELLLPQLDINGPKLTTTFFGAMALMIVYAIRQHRLFTLSPALAADTIISTMSDALIVLNLEKQIEIVNGSLLQLLGYRESELLGRKLQMLFESTESTLDDIWQKGPVNDYETKFRKKDGTPIPVSLSWSFLNGVNGKTLGVIFLGRDISERERTRLALQQARDQLERKVEERTGELKTANDQLSLKIKERKIIEQQLAYEKERLSITLRSITDGVITVDKEDRVVLLNRAAEDLTGWTNEEAFGKALSTVYQVKKNDNHEETTVESVLKNPNLFLKGRRSELLSRSQKNLIISEHGAPIFDQDGVITGVVIVFNDITEHEEMEQELFRTKKFESVSLLAYGIARDFNNLITGIITNLFMAKINMGAETDTYQLINTAEKAAFRASNLTNQLLSFAKGGSPFKETSSIKELIESSVGFYLSGSKSEYRLNIPEDLAMVNIDRGQIDQVLNNIIQNADQAMPDGGIIEINAENINIEEGQVVHLPSGKYVRISVCDHGDGIASDDINKIFDPYFTTIKGKSGLGLTLAFSIVRKHGGHITVKSHSGEGSTFSIYLPATDDIPETFNEMIFSGTDANCRRILVMENDSNATENISKLLENLGYRVELTSTSIEAVELYQKAMEENDKFDAAIFDFTKSAEQDACEISEQIFQTDPYAKMIVAGVDDEDPLLNNFSEHGFCAAILKPFVPGDLASLIQQVIHQTDSQPG
jgi:PAS domain S-box-containing protein